MLLNDRNGDVSTKLHSVGDTLTFNLNYGAGQIPY